jgi:hypothetical protein
MAQDKMEISSRESVVLTLRIIRSRFHTKAISQTPTMLMVSEEKVSVQIIPLMVRQTKVIKKIDPITITSTTSHKITHKIRSIPNIIKNHRIITTRIKRTTAPNTTLMAVMINMKNRAMGAERIDQYTMLEETTVKMKVIKINL